MDTHFFPTEEDARSFAAKSLRGDKADGPQIKQAAPVQFTAVTIEKALDRRKQILAKRQTKR